MSCSVYLLHSFDSREQICSHYRSISFVTNNSRYEQWALMILDHHFLPGWLTTDKTWSCEWHNYSVRQYNAKLSHVLDRHHLCLIIEMKFAGIAFVFHILYAPVDNFCNAFGLDTFSISFFSRWPNQEWKCDVHHYCHFHLPSILTELH